VALDRSELKNHHAILGRYFETLLMSGQRTLRGGHVQVAHHRLTVRKNIENAIAGMECRLHKRKDHGVWTGSGGDAVGKRSGTVCGRHLRSGSAGNGHWSGSSATSRRTGDDLRSS